VMGYELRHRWENNIEWVFGSTYSWSVRFCNIFEGKSINVWPGIWAKPCAFQIQSIQPNDG